MSQKGPFDEDVFKDDGAEPVGMERAADELNVAYPRPIAWIAPRVPDIAVVEGAVTELEVFVAPSRSRIMNIPK